MRFLKRSLRIIGLLAAVAIGVPALVIACLQIPAGRAFVSGVIGDLASSPDQRIVIDDLYLGFDLNAAVKKITLADETGTWIEADGLFVAWSPMNLLTGTLTLNSVSLDRLDINRLPQPAGTAVSAGDQEEPESVASGLPLDLSLGALKVREINLGEPVLGSPVAMTMAGSGGAALDPTVITADLRISRIDGVDGFLTAKSEFAPNAGTLLFDVTVSEPRGGLAARVLDLPNLPALDLTLNGSGPLDDWSAGLAVSLDGHQTATGTAKLSESDGDRHLSFNLDGDLAPLAPQEVQAFLLGATHAAGTAVFSEEFAPQSGTLNLKTQTVTLAANGTVHDKNLSAKADLAVDAGENALIALDLDGRRIAFGPMAASVSANGQMNSVDWSADIDLHSLRTTEVSSGRLQFSAKGSEADLDPEVLSTPFEVSLRSDDLQGLTAETEALSGALTVQGAGRVDGTSQSLNLSQINLKSEIAGLSVSNAYLGKDKISGSAHVSLADLSKFSKVANRDLGGVLGVTIGFDLDPRAIAGTADVSVTAHDLKTGFTQADAFLAGKTDAEGQFTLKGTNAVAVQKLFLLNAGLSASGTADYSDGTLASDLNIALSDLSLADPQLAGMVDIGIQTSGSVEGLNIAANARSDQILLGGTPLDNLSVAAEGVADRAAPSADIKGSADLNGQTVSIDVDLTSKDGAANLDPVAVRLAGNSITGALKVSSLESPLETLSGELKIAAPDLASISPLVLTDLGGSVDGTLTANPDSGKLLLNLSGADIDLPSLRLGTLQLNADLAHPFDPKNLTARLHLSDLMTSATPVRSARITAAPQDGGTDLSANVILEDSTDDGLTLSAHISQPSPDSYMLAVRQLALSYQGVASQLTQPATIRYAAGTADISPLKLSLGKGSVSISGSAGEKLGLRADLDAVPISLANAFVPGLALGGTLSGTASATGSSSSPDAAWSITGAGLTAAPLKENSLSVLGLTSTGTLKNNQVQQQTKITDPNGLSVSADGSIGLQAPQPLSLNVAGTIPTAVLRRPLLEAGLRADGSVSLKGSVSGSVQSPAYNLTATPSGLKVTSLSTGLTVQNIKGAATVTQEQAALNGISGELATGGALSASGTVGMKNGSPANLKLALNKARYIDPGLINAEIDADISITGQLAAASTAPLIGGTVTINKADVTIPESLPGAIAPVEVRHLHASAAVRRQAKELGGGKEQSAAKQKSNPPKLDVLVSAPGRIFIRGRGLEAELEGNLKIIGTTADPQAVGAFSLRRGQFDILTRRLTFSHGRATFEGSLTPVLDFAATSTVSDTTITVKVTGDADNPEISFTSSPELPQDEVLALLLFGKSVGNLSAAQIAQLGAAIATLTGGNDDGPLAQIRKSLGLDAIDIDTSGEDGPSVSVGRYINDNIYLGVEQGTQSGSSRVKVDIDLDRGLKVRGEVGADGSSKAGIFFEREY